MNKIKYIFISFVMIFVSSAFAGELKSFAPLVKKTIPSVVSIQATASQVESPLLPNKDDLPPGMQDFFEKFFKQMPRGKNPSLSQGSGFIFDKKGYVITNYHVINRASKVKVVLQNGTVYHSKVVGTDPLTDLAVLKLKKFKQPLPTLKFGDSEKSQVGDWVIAIGNPWGLGGSVTKGIISARGRNIQSGLYDDYIQTDAPINRGNSGGPLIDMNGQVIGINTAIFSSTGGSIGLGFAIPSNIAKNIAYQLINKGSVSRAWLGVSFRPVTLEIAESLGLKQKQGVIINGVQTGSPADRGGIKVGDVIFSFNGKKITNKLRLPMIVASSPIGKKLKMQVVRNGKIKDLSIILVKREEKTAYIDNPATTRDELPKTGIFVSEINNQLRKQYKIAKNINGLIIVGVNKSSSAHGLLKQGMVISQINSLNVKTIDDGLKAVGLAIKQNKKNILLVIETGKNSKNIITVSLD